MIGEWIKARWGEVSTKLGAMVGVVAVTAPQFVSVSPVFAWVGLGAAVLLVLWKEKPGA